MKLRNVIVPAALVAMTGFGAMNASARTDLFVNVNINSAHDFYQPLSTCGHWVQVENYGRCWYPAYVASDWRPYAEGYWLWTDGGWFWVSEEPWASACYHYGRWAWDPYYGWVWVPGTEWAPAWVAWREGGGYIGWAPLPPRCDFGPQGVIVAEQVVFAPHAFVFVETRHFCEPIRPAIIINQTIVHQTIINQTVNVTKIQRNNNVIINTGPNVQVIQNAAQREVPKSTVAELRHGKPDRISTAQVITATPSPSKEAHNDHGHPTVVYGRAIDDRENEHVVQPWTVKPKATERDPSLVPSKGVVLGTPTPEIRHHQEHPREAVPPAIVYKGGQVPSGQAVKQNEALPIPATATATAPASSNQPDTYKGKKFVRH